MKTFALVTLLLLGSKAMAAAPVYTNVTTQIRQSQMLVKAVDIDVNEQNCQLDDGRYSEGSSFRLALAFTCKMNLQTAAAPLISQGYEFGDVNRRHLGGFGSSAGVEVRPTGWQYELNEEPVSLFVDANETPDRDVARNKALAALKSGQLKVRLTFTKVTCLVGGSPVEKEYGDCPKFP
jgi:hypothetical protein